ncbi:MAG: sensor domain-containing diguanylate cyclase [Chloroflexota bacterium]
MVNTNDLSREELIAKIHQLETQISSFGVDNVSQEFLKFSWIANLGNWTFDVKNNIVNCNEEKFITLGFTPGEIPSKIGHEFFNEKLHPADHAPVMASMRKLIDGETQAYEVTYRIKTKSGKWKWFYDYGRIAKRDDDGKALLITGIVFDITEQKRIENLLISQNEQLTEMANTDYLTGVYNRRALHEVLNYEIKRVDRNKNPLTVVMFDIDDFKKINDDFGHLVGDDVLVGVANILKKYVRSIDIIGRFGGEEFIIVLPECSQDNGLKIADKIRAAIEQSIFEADIKLTVSGGVMEYQSGSMDHLLVEVDHALYTAKSAGKNRVLCC